MFQPVFAIIVFQWSLISFAYLKDFVGKAINSYWYLWVAQIIVHVKLPSFTCNFSIYVQVYQAYNKQFNGTRKVGCVRSSHIIANILSPLIGRYMHIKIVGWFS